MKTECVSIKNADGNPLLVGKERANKWWKYKEEKIG